MSALLAALSTVSPSPSPEVVTQTVVQTVQVLPDWAKYVKEAAPLLILGGLGWFASFLHGFVNPKLGKWANALLLYAYSLLLGLVGLITVGQLDLMSIDWSNPQVVGGAVLTVLGAAAARYAKEKAKETTTTEVVAAPVQF